MVLFSPLIYPQHPYPKCRSHKPKDKLIWRSRKWKYWERSHEIQTGKGRSRGLLNQEQEEVDINLFKCEVSQLIIIISMTEMIKFEKVDEINNNSQQEKSKGAAHTDFTDSCQIFNVQMTVSQANAITRLLPKGYSLHIDRAIKTKRTVKKKFTLDGKNLQHIQEVEPDIRNYEMAEQQVYNAIQTISYEDVIAKCLKILNLLRKNKNSWAFKEPVDPIAMGIPHYFDIITNPMDLRTVGENLAAHKYSTMSQFYADIHLIIQNSYTFNRSNAEFCQLTSDFEKYFQKIKSEPIIVAHPKQTVPKKSVPKIATQVQRKEPLPKQNVELAQRKELAMKLKYLPRDELLQIVTNINGERNSELNLETLPFEKVRALQDYLDQRDREIQKKVAKKMAGEESSFESESSEN